MSILKNCVLLLKSEKSDGTSDKYEDLLKSNNFEVILVKTLAFYYKNIEKLREKLLKPEEYSGILLSSPRCVAATLQALDKNSIQKLWGPLANFTVGETTYSEALHKLGIECKGKESGNAMNLAQIIIQNKTEFKKPFLFPHGNLKTDTLQIELGKANLHIEGVLVYDTVANPDIEQELEAATQGFNSIPEFVVFFSPSGLHSTLPYLKRIPVDLSSVKMIAIGPVTELALTEAQLGVVKVAKSPTPIEVLKAVLNV